MDEVHWVQGALGIYLENNMMDCINYYGIAIGPNKIVIGPYQHSKIPKIPSFTMHNRSTLLLH